LCACVCGRASHLDEFCFHHKIIEKSRFDYAINSHRDESIDFIPRFYSRALPRTFSHALPQFSHGPNHYSYGFCSRENHFVPRHFGYGPRPHHGDHFPCRHGFPAEGSHSNFEPNGEVQ
jgi:hypothetical protein